MTTARFQMSPGQKTRSAESQPATGVALKKRLMEGDISEHNAIKLKYHRKRYKQFLSAIPESVNDGHKKKSITSINVIRSGRGAPLLWGSRLLTNNLVDKQEPKSWDGGGAAAPEASWRPVCLLSFLKLHVHVKLCAADLTVKGTFQIWKMYSFNLNSAQNDNKNKKWSKMFILKRLIE